MGFDRGQFAEDQKLSDGSNMVIEKVGKLLNIRSTISYMDVFRYIP